MLGEGGSGETWLMEDNASGALVAVKLIKRPIPKVLHEMILHEILVRPIYLSIPLVFFN